LSGFSIIDAQAQSDGQSRGQDEEAGQMPWTGKSFAKHNKGLGKSGALKAASVANAVLRDSGDEGKAIRIANWNAAGRPRRQQGGEVQGSQGAPGDPTGSIYRSIYGGMGSGAAATLRRKMSAPWADVNSAIQQGKAEEISDRVPRGRKYGGKVQGYAQGGKVRGARESVREEAREEGESIAQERAEQRVSPRNARNRLRRPMQRGIISEKAFGKRLRDRVGGMDEGDPINASTR
jgi:hypothetical protein